MMMPADAKQIAQSIVEAMDRQTEAIKAQTVAIYDLIDETLAKREKNGETTPVFRGGPRYLATPDGSKEAVASEQLPADD